MTPAVAWTRQNFLTRTRMFLALLTFRSATWAAPEPSIVAPRAAIAPVVIAARRTLGLRVGKLASEGRSARKAYFSVRRDLCDHNGDLISDAQYILDPIDSNCRVLGELGDVD
jgi:hypothetical protein